jgi:hypothetical protein
MAVTLPFTFANGTIADANQVNSNFNALLGGVNIGGPAAGQPWSVAQGGTGASSFPIPNETGPGGFNWGLAYSVVVSNATGTLQSMTGSQGYVGGWGSNDFVMVGVGNSAGSTPYIQMGRARGTWQTPTNVMANDNLGSIFTDGWVGTGMSATSGGALVSCADQNWSATAQGTRWEFWNCVNGTTTGVLQMTLNNAGNLTVSGTVTPGVSDPRLKESVNPYEPGLDAIRALTPISWQWNGKAGKVKDGTVYVGVSADEAEGVLPFAVGKRPPVMASQRQVPFGEGESVPLDGDTTEYKTLDYNPIICALITAVKELAAKVEALAK